MANRDSSSDEDDDMEDFELFNNFLDIQYQVKEVIVRKNPFDDYNEKKFKERFRLGKVIVLMLLEDIQDNLEYYNDKNNSVSPINQLLITLRFYATGTLQLVIGDLFGVHRLTACRIIHRVTNKIAGLKKRYIQFPRTFDERKKVMDGFQQISQFPGVVGAIDCTHVPIQFPGGEDAQMYRNRKHYHSINVQLVCDSGLYIENVVARWAGSVHDSIIFDNCALRRDFENKTIPNGVLVGDGGYACCQYMMTPLTDANTAAEKLYNKSQIACRNPIERTNGVLKRRFPALKYGLRISLKNVIPVIVAIVVCHNIAMNCKDDEPPEDTQLVDYINRRRRRGLRVDFEEVDVPLAPLGLGVTAWRTDLINTCFTV